MPYVNVINAGTSITSAGEKQEWIREMNLLRAELDDLRTKFGTLLAKLDADAGVTDANYASTQALAASRFTAV